MPIAGVHKKQNRKRKQKARVRAAKAVRYSRNATCISWETGFYATAAAALSISWREMERAAAAAAEWPVSQEMQVAFLE